jgi:hypothetical protein
VRIRRAHLRAPSANLGNFRSRCGYRRHAPMNDFGTPAPPPSESRTPQPHRSRLRTIAIAVLATCTVVAALFYYERRPSIPKKVRSLEARLDLAAGEVTVLDARQDNRALSGTPLGVGATITTAKGARALVRTGVGAALFMRGETSIKLLPQGVELASGETVRRASADQRPSRSSTALEKGYDS